MFRVTRYLIISKTESGRVSKEIPGSGSGSGTRWALYSFRGFPGVGSWQECGEYTFFSFEQIIISPFFSGLLCQRYNGGGDDPRCEFWSITPQPSGLCLLFSEGADEYPQDYPGAFSGERQCVD